MRKLKLLLAGLMCVILLPVSLYAQIKTISGQVTDTKSNPLASASVLITHSTQGTSTDAEGKFKITVPENAFIVVSAIGYKSQTFKVSDISGDLSVKLEEDVAKLEEVVVTGLTTTVKRRNLANSVATVNSKQLNGVAPAQTFDACIERKNSGCIHQLKHWRTRVGALSVKAERCNIHLRKHATALCCRWCVHGQHGDLGRFECSYFCCSREAMHLTRIIQAVVSQTFALKILRT
jgi:hypothetical protein